MLVVGTAEDAAEVVALVRAAGGDGGGGGGGGGGAAGGGAADGPADGPADGSDEACCPASCPVCFCAPSSDEGSGQPAVVLAGCGCTYCAECFEGWVAQARFPLRCFGDGCGRPVGMRQLRLELGDGFLPLLRLALDEHVNANADALRFCVTPDCPDVYEAGGSRVVCCSSCACATCTHCHVEDHAGLTCEQYAKSKAPADEVRNAIVEEGLTDRCPHCRNAFWDFEGCCAVRCSSCPGHFCGWCLAKCDGSAAAHEHVRSCEQKPAGADAYFGSADQLVAARRRRQRQRVVQQLAKLDASARAAALASIEADLQDLGIDLGGD
jgi:hypothetical protein